MADIEDYVREFLSRVDAYSKATGFADSSISQRIFNDSRSVERLRAGWRGMALSRLEEGRRLLAALEARPKYAPPPRIPSEEHAA